MFLDGSGKAICHPADGILPTGRGPIDHWHKEALLEINRLSQSGALGAKPSLVGWVQRIAAHLGRLAIR